MPRGPPQGTVRRDDNLNSIYAEKIWSRCIQNTSLRLYIQRKAFMGIGPSHSYRKKTIPRPFINIRAFQVIPAENKWIIWRSLYGQNTISGHLLRDLVLKSLKPCIGKSTPIGLLWIKVLQQFYAERRVPAGQLWTCFNFLRKNRPAVSPKSLRICEWVPSIKCILLEDYLRVLYR